MIELLVSVLILGTIAYFAVANYYAFKLKAHQSKGREFAQQIISQQTKYYAEWKRYTLDPVDLGFSGPFQSTPPFYDAVLQQCSGPESLTHCVEVVVTPNTTYSLGNTLVITANTRDAWSEVL